MTSAITAKESEGEALVDRDNVKSTDISMLGNQNRKSRDLGGGFVESRGGSAEEEAVKVKGVGKGVTLLLQRQGLRVRDASEGSVKGLRGVYTATTTVKSSQNCCRRTITSLPVM